MRRDLVTVAGFGALVVAANAIGERLLELGWRTRILAAPLIGRFETTLGWRTVPLAIVSIGLVVVLPRAAHDLTWRHLLAVTGGGLALWSVALAFNRGGMAEVARPMGLPGHTLLDVGSVHSPGTFVREYIARIDDYGTHVRAHPPGFLLVLWVLDRAGLGGAAWAGWLVVSTGAIGAMSVLVTARNIAGAAFARSAAPFLVLAPAALYVASTADAFYAGVSAAGVAAITVSTSSSGGRRDLLAFGGGLLLGASLVLSYGLILIGVPVAAILVTRRAWRVAAASAAAVTAVIGGFALAGFWWLDGLNATRGEYAESVAAERPYLPFLVINAAALAIIVGPAAIAGLTRLADPANHRAARVIAIGWSCVLLAAISGLSKGEVERIWLPFALFILPAGALAVAGRGLVVQRSWLAAQASVAIAVQCLVRTNW